ncbi:hypothetical protein LCGC14_0446290 [marine sediment metagenome]|uniref:Uncharacterized protein n=1 Tax=marine sediment metagenome TaxID=412755 RepID=A0A0F9SPV8_9ZZZZ
MQTPAERARKDAFREWLSATTSSDPPGYGRRFSSYEVRILEEAFVVGWNARDKFVEESR